MADRWALPRYSRLGTTLQRPRRRQLGPQCAQRRDPAVEETNCPAWMPGRLRTAARRVHAVGFRPPPLTATSHGGGVLALLIVDLLMEQIFATRCIGGAFTIGRTRRRGRTLSSRSVEGQAFVQHDGAIFRTNSTLVRRHIRSENRVSVMASFSSTGCNRRR